MSGHKTNPWERVTLALGNRTSDIVLIVGLSNVILYLERDCKVLVTGRLMLCETMRSLHFDSTRNVSFQRPVFLFLLLVSSPLFSDFSYPSLSVTLPQLPFLLTGSSVLDSDSELTWDSLSSTPSSTPDPRLPNPIFTVGRRRVSPYDVVNPVISHDLD